MTKVKDNKLLVLGLKASEGGKDAIVRLHDHLITTYPFVIPVEQNEPGLAPEPEPTTEPQE